MFSTVSAVFSDVVGAVRILVDVPVLAIGIIIGAFAYNYILKKYPTLLAKLVTDASADLQKIATSVASAASKAAIVTNAAASMSALNAVPVVPSPVVAPTAPTTTGTTPTA